MSGRQSGKNHFMLDETVDKIATETKRLEEDRGKLAAVLKDAKQTLQGDLIPRSN